jgi:hypothetical protein
MFPLRENSRLRPGAQRQRVFAIWANKGKGKQVGALRSGLVRVIWSLAACVLERSDRGFVNHRLKTILLNTLVRRKFRCYNIIDFAHNFLDFENRKIRITTMITNK